MVWNVTFMERNNACSYTGCWVFLSLLCVESCTRFSACLMDRLSNCGLHVLKGSERDCLFLSLALSWQRPPGWGGGGDQPLCFLCSEASGGCSNYYHKLDAAVRSSVQITSVQWNVPKLSEFNTFHQIPYLHFVLFNWNTNLQDLGEKPINQSINQSQLNWSVDLLLIIIMI